MTTIAELMDLAEIPHMDDYGGILPAPHAPRPSPRRSPVTGELEDIEEEEGERKLLFDQMFHNALTPACSPAQVAFAASNVPIAGANTLFAPRPLVPPPAHLQMDAATRARVFGKKFGPPQATIVICHRCGAAMRVCVRKLKYVDHIKEYPSYRCTRKGCQTFKSMRIVSATTPTALFVPPPPPARIMRIPPEKKSIANFRQMPLPQMINPYADIQLNPLPELCLPPAPPHDAQLAPDARQVLPVLTELQPPTATTTAATQSVQQVVGGVASLGCGTPLLVTSPPALLYTTAKSAGAPRLSPSSGYTATGIGQLTPPGKKPTQEPRKRSRYDTCTEEQKEAVAALLKKHVEELERSMHEPTPPNPPQQQLPKRANKTDVTTTTTAAAMPAISHTNGLAQQPFNNNLLPVTMSNFQPPGSPTRLPPLALPPLEAYIRCSRMLQQQAAPPVRKLSSVEMEALQQISTAART
ncbi:hypothetical protein PFISCL1PPCAC_16340, partial [Pristionchus fissidentatus]